MQLLVTGGTGFVMSHVVRQWVERSPRHVAVVVDCFAPDAALERFFAGHEKQISVIDGSVTDPGLWAYGLAELAPDYLVHGAAMTPNRGESERRDARRVVEVNVVGVLNALEWARERASLRRLVHVSTGSVYAADGPDGPLPEDGFEARSPDSLYPITKRAGELLALRYRELFDLPLAVCRLSSIYGPLDRWTPGRDFRCAPNLIVARALAGEPIRIAGADAVGDWLHAADVARGILALLDAPRLEYSLFNIAYGETASLARLCELVAAAVPGTRWTDAPPADADLVTDPGPRRGTWGAYDVSRLRALGWSPTPLGDALADYVAWVRAEQGRDDTRSGHGTAGRAM